MNKSRYPTKVKTLIALLILATILILGAGVVSQDMSGFIVPDFFGSEFLKEEGPGLRPGPRDLSDEVLKEEGPGLKYPFQAIEVEIVKEEGPGLRKPKPGRGIGV